MTLLTKEELERRTIAVRHQLFDHPDELNLGGLVDKYGRDSRLVFEYDYDDISVFIETYTLESDAVYEARIAQTAKRRQAATERKKRKAEAKEAYDRAEYERLKTKFSDG